MEMPTCRAANINTWDKSPIYGELFPQKSPFPAPFLACQDPMLPFLKEKFSIIVFSPDFNPLLNACNGL